MYKDDVMFYTLEFKDMWLLIMSRSFGYTKLHLGCLISDNFALSAFVLTYNNIWLTYNGIGCDFWQYGGWTGMVVPPEIGKKSGFLDFYG